MATAERSPPLKYSYGDTRKWTMNTRRRVCVVQVDTMKKGIRILLAMSLVASLFVVGFAGNAAATDYHHKKKAGNSQHSWQYANSHVDQEQYVAQGNWNKQDDNYAVSAAFGEDAESDEAYATQASYQSNHNSQSAWSNAENDNEQEWED
jgi:hypothetical protein